MKRYEAYKDSSVEWLGEIPGHWEVKKLKWSVEIQNGYAFKSEFFAEEGIAILRIGDISSEINISECKKTTEPEPSTIFKVRKGDTLIALSGATVGKMCYINQDFEAYINQRVARITSDGYWLYCVLNSDFFLKQIFLKAGGSAQDNISTNDLGNFSIPLPPLAEQTSIAHFLDRKTSQIDSLVEKKKRLIELLKEEKTAVINQAVTKGLDPNVQMKDSGVEWLGEIPEHWEVKKIGHLAKVVRGASPRPAGDPRFFDGDHTPWITVAEVTKDSGKYIDSVSEYLTSEGKEESRFVEIGTLLLSNSGATLGVPKILKISGCINDGSVAFLNLKNKANIEFLFYFFISHTKIYRDEVSGYGQPNLNTDIVKGTRIALPPVLEQQAIVDWLEEKQTRIDSTISKIEKEIELLQEYRTALISEVVTGKVRVDG